MSDVPDIILEARGVSKRYGANMALNDVTFRVHRGRVNVLIGENGAGKSTLMRLFAGAERATAGEILMDGRVLELRSPREATAQGIAIVHQELAVMGNLDIAENIFAGRELVRRGFVDRGAIVGRPVLIYWSRDSASEGCAISGGRPGAAESLRAVLHVPRCTRWPRLGREVH